jgi:hypothetical protein
MNISKTYWMIVGIALIPVFFVVLLLNTTTPQTNFEMYKSYAKQVNVVDWSISEGTAKSFAEANCEKLAVGDMPAIRFQNEDHVKSSAAILAAYCPKSFSNFLAGVIMNHSEYKETALYVNERLEIAFG